MTNPIQRVQERLIARFLALLLALQLSMTSPAMALRTQAGLENDTGADIANTLKPVAPQK